MNTSIDVNHDKVWTLLKIYLIDRHVLSYFHSPPSVMKVIKKYHISDECGHRGCVEIGRHRENRTHWWITPDYFDGNTKCSEEWRTFYLQSGCQEFIDDILSSIGSFDVELTEEERRKMVEEINQLSEMIGAMEAI